MEYKNYYLITLLIFILILYTYIPHKNYSSLYYHSENICLYSNNKLLIKNRCNNNMNDNIYVINAYYKKYIEEYGVDKRDSLIICFAAGYKWNNIKNFVLSLRFHKYNGDIFLFIKEDQENILKEYFYKYNVKYLLINDNYPFYSNKNIEYIISNKELNKCMLKKRNYGSYKWHTYRFSLIYCFLSIYGKRYSNILSCDVRDIIFQSNPFLWNIEDHLYLVEETDYIRIKDNKCNDKWIKKYKHYKDVRMCKILNSGVIIGKTNLFIKFYKRYIDFLDKNYVNTAEQGALNYFFYTNNLNDNNVIINRNGYGFVATVGLEVELKHSTDLFPQEDNFIYNYDGSKPCMIHQYDRYINEFNNYIKFHSSVE